LGLGVIVGVSEALRGGISEYLKIALYFAAAITFWVWLHRDATERGVSRAWQLVVGAGWLVAAIPVAPAYLLVTRGWLQGSLATLIFLAALVGLFGLFMGGMFVSMHVVEALAGRR
jgi:hypothetical protein